MTLREEEIGRKERKGHKIESDLSGQGVPGPPSETFVIFVSFVVRNSFLIGAKFSR
jgi:hypothetical protein